MPSITSQSGIFGLALQVNGLKGGAASSFYRYKTLAANLGPILNEQMSRPEMGGSNNPTGLYLSSAGYGGSASLQPRLEGDFGWILLAACGGCATVLDSPGAGVNRHTFSQAIAANGGAKFLPFFQARRYIPGATLADAIGDYGIDCLLNSLTMSFAPGQPVQAEMAVQGREPQLTTTGAPASGWTWADTTEDFDSVPVPMRIGAGITIADLYGGNPLPLTNARVTLQNNTTSQDEEMVIGSYFAEDFTPKMRTLSFEATYKWKDAELYRYLFNGGDPTNAVINPCLTYKTTVLTVLSPCDIDPGTIDFPWQLQIVAPKVRWRMQGPPQLAGDDLIQMQLAGTAIEADSTDPEDYFQFILDNEQTAYIIPAA